MDKRPQLVLFMVPLSLKWSFQSNSIFGLYSQNFKDPIKDFSYFLLAGAPDLAQVKLLFAFAMALSRSRRADRVFIMFAIRVFPNS